MLPSTKGKCISDKVKFQHHSITIPELKPANQILEAMRQLEEAIHQQLKRAAMDKMRAINIMRKVILGERQAEIPQNSVQILINATEQNVNMGVTHMPPTQAWERLVCFRQLHHNKKGVNKILLTKTPPLQQKRWPHPHDP